MSVPQTQSEVTLREPAWLHALLWAGFPLLGAVLLATVQISAGWLSRLPFVPFGDIVEWMSTVPQPQGLLGAAGVGAIAGAGIGFLGYRDTLRIELGNETVSLKRPGRDQPVSVPLADVDTAFRSRRDLVLLDDGGDELARENTDIPQPRLREAFTAYGIAWRDDDPYAGEWKRWFDGMAGLPEGAHALLRTREKALRDDKSADAQLIRQELRHMGVMVRHEGKKQFWRTIDEQRSSNVSLRAFLAQLPDERQPGDYQYPGDQH